VLKVPRVLVLRVLVPRVLVPRVLVPRVLVPTGHCLLVQTKGSEHVARRRVPTPSFVPRPSYCEITTLALPTPARA